MLFSISQFEVHFFICEIPNETSAMKGSLSGHSSEHVVFFTTYWLSGQEETHLKDPSDSIKPLIH